VKVIFSIVCCPFVSFVSFVSFVFVCVCPFSCVVLWFMVCGFVVLWFCGFVVL